MKFNYNRLKGLMREKGETITSLAEKIGINPSTLCLKLANRSSFLQKEIVRICQVLETTEYDALFFNYET